MLARPAGDTVPFEAGSASPVISTFDVSAFSCAVGHATAPSTPRRPTLFRSGRWFFLIEGLLAGLLAGLAIVAHGLRFVHGMEGFTVWGLTLSPEPSGLLFVFGVAAVLATLNRRAAIVVAATGTAAFFVLTALGDTGMNGALAGRPRTGGLIDAHR